MCTLLDQYATDEAVSIMSTAVKQAASLLNQCHSSVSSNGASFTKKQPGHSDTDSKRGSHSDTDSSALELLVGKQGSHSDTDSSALELLAGKRGSHSDTDSSSLELLAGKRGSHSDTDSSASELLGGSAEAMWSREDRRRSSNLSDLGSSHCSTGSTRSTATTEFSSEFEEYYESFQKHERKLQHTSIKEEVNQPIVQEYAHSLVLDVFQEGIKLASQINPGLQTFNMGLPPDVTKPKARKAPKTNDLPPVSTKPKLQKISRVNFESEPQSIPITPDQISEEVSSKHESPSTISHEPPLSAMSKSPEMSIPAISKSNEPPLPAMSKSPEISIPAIPKSNEPPLPAMSKSPEMSIPAISRSPDLPVLAGSMPQSQVTEPVILKDVTFARPPCASKVCHVRGRQETEATQSSSVQGVWQVQQEKQVQTATEFVSDIFAKVIRESGMENDNEDCHESVNRSQNESQDKSSQNNLNSGNDLDVRNDEDNYDDLVHFTEGILQKAEELSRDILDESIIQAAGTLALQELNRLTGKTEDCQQTNCAEFMACVNGYAQKMLEDIFEEARQVIINQPGCLRDEPDVKTIDQLGCPGEETPVKVEIEDEALDPQAYQYVDGFIHTVMQDAMLIFERDYYPDGRRRFSEHRSIEEGWIEPLERARANSLYFDAEFGMEPCRERSMSALDYEQFKKQSRRRRKSLEDRRRTRTVSVGFRDTTLSDFELQLRKSNPMIPQLDLTDPTEQPAFYPRRASEPVPHFRPFSPSDSVVYNKERAFSNDSTSSRELILDWLNGTREAGPRRRSSTHTRSRTTSISHLDWFAQDLLLEAFNDAFLHMFSDTSGVTIPVAVTTQDNAPHQHMWHNNNNLPVGLDMYADGLVDSIITEAALDYRTLLERCMCDRRSSEASTDYEDTADVPYQMLINVATELADQVMAEAVDVLKQQTTNAHQSTRVSMS